MTADIEIHQTIDTCGTRCPIPLLRAKQTLKDMLRGDLLRVLATDPSAKSDFEAMLKHLPHDLIEYSCSTETSEYPRIDTFIIRKG